MRTKKLQFKFKGCRTVFQGQTLEQAGVKRALSRPPPAEKNQAGKLCQGCMELLELHEEAVNAAEVARDQAEQGREKAMMSVTDMETNYTIALEQAKAAESSRDYYKRKYTQLH